MKIILFLMLASIVIVSGCAGQGNKQTQDHQNMMNHIAMEAHGGEGESVGIHMYRVHFERPKEAAGEQTKLKFKITELYSEKAIENFEIVHEKIMHVVLVRDDLRYFDHIHPEVPSPGIFEIPYKFLAPGKYRVWVAFIVDGMGHLVDFDFEVKGEKTEAEPDNLKGIKVQMEPIPEITATKEYDLKFTVLDSENKPINIDQRFLAATAHLIDIDQSLEEFVHNHDENFDKDNLISFTHNFKKAGKHKLWVQFLVAGQKKTAPFEVEVK